MRNDCVEFEIDRTLHHALISRVRGHEQCPESFEKEVVFDLPVDAKAPRLDMHDGHALIEKVLVGDEDSIFHKRNFFKLSEQNDLTGVK